VGAIPQVQVLTALDAYALAVRFAKIVIGISSKR
jgi:hypothetical protein